MEILFGLFVGGLVYLLVRFQGANAQSDNEHVDQWLPIAEPREYEMTYAHSNGSLTKEVVIPLRLMLISKEIRIEVYCPGHDRERLYLASRMSQLRDLATNETVSDIEGHFRSIVRV